MTPEEEAPFNNLKAARAARATHRPALEAALATVEAEELAMKEAQKAEAAALKAIKTAIGKLKKGEDKFVTTSDGTQWHVEMEGRQLRVEQVKEPAP